MNRKFSNLNRSLTRPTLSDKSGRIDLVKDGVIAWLANVQAGINPTDAVNVSQLEAAIAGARLVQLTRVEALALMASNSLITGQLYEVTDAAPQVGCEGVFVIACHDADLAKSGLGIFQNADYQNDGDYSGVTTANGFPVNTTGVSIGIWDIALSVNLGDIAIWNNLHWLNLTGLIGTAPDGDAINWQPIPKTTINGGYIINTDAIIYDIEDDDIYFRRDERGNVFALSASIVGAFGFNPIPFFQWGRNSVSDNEVHGSYLNNINALQGQIAIHLDQLSSAVITENCVANGLRLTGNSSFEGSGNTDAQLVLIDLLGHLTVEDSAVVSGLKLNNSVTILATGGTNLSISDISIPNLNLSLNGYSGAAKTANLDSSNFSDTLDLDDPAVYDVGTKTLTISLDRSFIGIINLFGAGASYDIETIVNMSSFFNTRFYPSSGITALTFVNGVSSNQPHFRGGGNVVLDGSQGDWIELFYSQDGNIRQNLNSL